MKIKLPIATIYLIDGSYLEFSNLPSQHGEWVSGESMSQTVLNVPVKSILYIEEDDDED